MKKLRFELFASVVVVMFALVACSSDDPEIENIDQLYGSWITKHMKMTTLSGGAVIVERDVESTDEGYLKITFGENGSIMAEELGENNLWKTFSKGTYAVKGNKIRTITVDVDDPDDPDEDEMTIEQLTPYILVLSTYGEIEGDSWEDVPVKLTIEFGRATK